MREQSPSLVISLDFELMWGVRDTRTVTQYGGNVLGVRAAIPEILKLFGRYRIRATWAAVGMLLFDRKAELLDHLPEVLPEYDARELSPYAALGSLGDTEEADPYHFGLSLARRVLETEGMDLGTHTFSHYYCLEKGQGVESFTADLDTARRRHEEVAGYGPRSLVFPRNQYNAKYLDACASAGIRVFRGNIDSLMYRGSSADLQTLPVRALRLADSYLNLSGDNAVVPSVDSGLLNIRASRFLRPSLGAFSCLEQARLRRITRSMLAAARAGRHFHLWWHPHNFGIHLQRNLAFLERILQVHERLRGEFGVRSRNMADFVAPA